MKITTNYDAIMVAAEHGIEELNCYCPHCGNNVTLWTTGYLEFADKYHKTHARYPDTLKCGWCNTRFHYTVEAKQENNTISWTITPR